MNPYLFAWFCVGLWFTLQHAKGQPLTTIPNHWQRRSAWLLTLPCYVSLWLIMRTIAYLAFLAGDLPIVWKTAKDSWNGLPQTPSEEQ